MDKTIPVTQTAALEELFEINHELGYAAAQVDPELSAKSFRAAYLLGLLSGAATGAARWPVPRRTA